MKHFIPPSCRCVLQAPWLLFLAVSLLVTSVHSSRAQENDEAEKAWEEVEKAARPPQPPEEWRNRRPTDEERKSFLEEQGKLAVVAADRAKDFYTRYPKHPNAEEAREREYEMLKVAHQLGNTSQFARIEAIEQQKLKDPSLTEDDRFELRAEAIQRTAMSKRPDGMDAVLGEFEKGVRVLQKEFPKRSEPYEMLMMIAANSEGEKARALAREILDSPAEEDVKEEARAVLKKMEALGKPVDIKFTSLDGKEIDLTKMKGKVVLVDFWATWCQPCIVEMPNVKAAYEKLHPKGFEILGISFDNDKGALQRYVAKEKIAWPQYFDGKGWNNDLGRKFGITSIPTMWLVDKKGNLRDLSARADLAAKVEKLLAE
jgi:thiol-disulfide isomerase/thioredoxin